MLSALWGILGLLALVTLFIIYVNYPDYVSLDFLALPEQLQLDRHRFFFIFSGLYLVVNLVTFIALRLVYGFRNISQSVHPKQHLKTAIALKTLVVGANIFLITLMIYSRSSIEAQSLAASWHWLVLMLGPLVIVSGLIFLIYTWLFPGQYG